MHFCHFNHRFSMQRVSFVAVEGDVSASSITMGSDVAPPSAPPIAHPLPIHPVPIHPYPPSKVAKIVFNDKYRNNSLLSYRHQLSELSRRRTCTSSSLSTSSWPWSSSSRPWPWGSSFARLHSRTATTTTLFSDAIPRAQISLHSTP